MKRRILSTASVLAVGALALTSCAGAAGTADDGGAEGRTLLTVSVWNYEGTPEFAALFDAYEAANPDIDIQPVDILADNYAEKVTTMLAGGDDTDVLTMKNVIDYSRFANRGQLEDISDVVADLPGDELAGLDAFELDGAYYAAPYRQDFWLLYYNKDLFDAAGVDYPEDMTWEEYEQVAEKIAAETDAYGTYQHVWRSLVHSTAAAQSGGDLIGGDYGFLKDRYETALNLQDAGASLAWSTATSQQTGYGSMFETEQAAMVPMGTWYIAALLKAQNDGVADFDWGLAAMPQLESGGEVTTFGSPTSFAVNGNAAHSQEAREFIAWAAGEEGAAAIAEIGVVPALRTDAITEAYFGIDGMPGDDGSAAAFSPDVSELEMPVSELSSDVDQILTEEHQLIMSGEKSVDAGIADMEKRVKNEVLD